MKKPRRGAPLAASDAVFAATKKKPVPFEFVLDELSAADPRTRPMFGCVAVYLGDKIVFVLRDKPAPATDNGVWLATTTAHHASLREEFPAMRSVSVLGPGVTGWQLLPADAPDFESSVLRACELALAGDARIGKVPGARAPRATPAARARKPPPAASAKKSRGPRAGGR